MKSKIKVDFNFDKRKALLEFTNKGKKENLEKFNSSKKFFKNWILANFLNFLGYKI